MCSLLQWLLTFAAACATDSPRDAVMRSREVVAVPAERAAPPSAPVAGATDQTATLSPTGRLAFVDDEGAVIAVEPRAA